MPNGFGFEPYNGPAGVGGAAGAAPVTTPVDPLGAMALPGAPATTQRFQANVDPLSAMPGAPPMGVPRVEAPVDPTQEHSATSTRLAIAEALQRLGARRGPTTGADPRPTNPANIEQLARLGLPPTEIALLTQSGGVRG